MTAFEQHFEALLDQFLECQQNLENLQETRKLLLQQLKSVDSDIHAALDMPGDDLEFHYKGWRFIIWGIDNLDFVPPGAYSGVQAVRCPSHLDIIRSTDS